MARRRSILSGMWLQLTLQAAFAVATANASDTAQSIIAHHPSATLPDEAFVLTFAPTDNAPPPPSSFEDFSLLFYLPPEPRSADDYALLPDLDTALLGGPEPSYDWQSADLILFN
jgi:hypothetical protein